MNIAIEEVSTCRRRIKIEVPSDEVDKEIDRITTEFQKVATIKGFRAGKAPRSVIEKRFHKDIEEELKRTLVPKAFREAIKSKNLDVIHVPGVEEVQFQRGVSMSFSTVVDLAPSFALPQYKGIRIKKHDDAVDDTEMEKVIDRLREQQANYNPVEGRAVQEGDFAIINYTGAIDGQSIAELAPDNTSLSSQEKFWLWVKDDVFLPGFAKQIIGANKGETRAVEVVFPDDFPAESLRGKKAVYQATVEDIRERELPPFDDEFSQNAASCTAEELRTRIRDNMAREKGREAKNQHLRQIFDHLRTSTTFDLPESSVQEETQNLLYQIVRENQMRGISNEMLEEKRQEIFTAAHGSAQDRVKLSFILSRISKEEKIEVSGDEIKQELVEMAARSDMSVEKLVKKIQESDRGLGQLEDDIRNRKTIDFLLQSAVIE